MWIENYHFSAKDWITSYMKRLQLQTHQCSSISKWRSFCARNWESANFIETPYLSTTTINVIIIIISLSPLAPRFWVVKPAKWVYVRPITDTDTDPLQIQGLKNLGRDLVNNGRRGRKVPRERMWKEKPPISQVLKISLRGERIMFNQSNKKYVDSVKSCFKITMDYLKLGTIEESHIYVNLFLWRIPRIYICYGPNQPRFDTNIEKYETTQSLGPQASILIRTVSFKHTSVITDHWSGRSYCGWI